MFLISDLLSVLERYLDQEQVRSIYRAYLFAAEAHDGQYRKTGEPYIYHPIEVARILAEMHIDYTTIIAAILHDVLEDTDYTKQELIDRFGEDATELVDGVSKLTRMQMESPQHAQAENFRKMMLAMTRDIRVILIKLADRLHNMRTLSGMRAEKRRRIARETLEIHVPIAHRLGMNKIAHELRELGFSNLYPMRARILKEAVQQARGHRKEILDTIEVTIRRRLLETDLEVEVQGREKHLYSLYKKMKDQRLPFREIFDVYAFRIIVPSVEACYQTLGIVHSIYKPLPGKFKDYIAIPKANGYQSLHTVLFGPHGVPVEIQIRTQEMHLISEEGIAAHWDYKNDNPESSSTANVSGTEKRARQWLQDLLDLQKNSGNSLEFLESVKIDLFPDEVYVFTPKGKIIELPRGATVLDLAFRIHTEIGTHAVSARVNRKSAPLNTHLHNGQTVEIITAEDSYPHPGWLQYVTTGKARSNIRNYLKNLQEEEASLLGERLLIKALSRRNISKKRFKKMDLKPLLEKLQLQSMEQLYNEIGMGIRMAELVTGTLIQTCIKSGSDEEPNKKSPKQRRRWNPLSMLSPLLKRRLHNRHTDGRRPLMIRGAEGMVVHFAKCCRPIPGDPIIGHISSGKGLVIHRSDCNNGSNMQSNPEQWVSVEWSQKVVPQELPTEIKVEVANKRGVLAIIASTISEQDSNIDNVAIDDQDGRTNIITFTLRVSGRKHLAEIIRNIRKLKPVITIQRVKG